jgi:SfnB family sulfur acquisition oxidoreductase
MNEITQPVLQGGAVEGFPALAKVAEPAHVIASDAEAIEIAHRLAADFAKEASERDRDRRLPIAELDRFSQSGLWSMNVPKAFGGAAVSYATVAEVFEIIAAADASIAQMAQNHVSLIDLVRFASEDVQRHFYNEVLRGVRFGNAVSEKGGKTILDFKTRIVASGDDYFINGEKFYCTGAMLAHIVPVNAIDEQGRGVLAMVVRDAPGLTVIDDWTGFGQRTTASGTVRLENVHVPASHVIPTYRAFQEPSVHGPVAQIIQAAIDAGIAHQAIEETIRFVREFSRPWADSGLERAADDPYTIREIGDLKIRLHAAEALLERAGRAIDATLLDENAETVAATSIKVAEAKVLTTEIAILATNKLFELGGSRATLESLNLNRYWRDARTHTLHDPVRWKFHAIGDYFLNGKNPPRHSWL